MNILFRPAWAGLLAAMLFTGCMATVEQQQTARELVTTPDVSSPNPAVEEETQRSTELETAIETPEEVEDLWQRIRMQLRFPYSDHPRVTQRVAWYMRHPNYMHTISERASPFLYYLVSEVEKRGLPIEIALMPLIESDFDTEAYSHKHASGIWQLTPYIAKHFGIRINAWYDGRQDIVDATQASLDFIEYLHKRFDGNWYHTIAAYNTGEGRVFRAIRRNRQAGKPTNFFSLNLPEETRHFVPRLLAVSQLLRHHLMDFPAIDNRPVISVLPLPQQAIVPDADHWREIDRLNPGFARFPALIEGGGHIIIPTVRVAEWNTMISALPPIAADTWLQYTIRPGDTLSEIAARYSLSVGQLKTFNQLKSDRIRAGKHLLLPMLADKQVDYTVKSGDSLWRIARRFGISVAKLKQWNGLSSDTLQIGKTLSLFLNQS